MCYTALRYRWLLIYAEWFHLAVFLWGAALILGPAHFLLEKLSRKKLIVIRGACVACGLLVVYAAIQLDRPPQFYYWGRWFTIGAIAWGALASIVSAYFLLRDKGVQTTSVH
jgi:hypothetical protein